MFASWGGRATALLVDSWIVTACGRLECSLSCGQSLAERAALRIPNRSPRRASGWQGQGRSERVLLDTPSVVCVLALH